MDVKKIPEYVMEALEGRGLDAVDIRRASAEELFDEFCNWNGLIGWGPQIRRTYAILKDCESTEGN